MAAQPCAQHPTVIAVCRCDGCERLLCQQCVREGHRLLFCTVCGERALPLAKGVAATTQALRKATQASSYTLVDALGYPFRGLGKFLYFGYLALVAVMSFLSFIPFVGCLLVPYTLAIALLVPGLHFAIIRTTAAGDNELPDWPDFTEVLERLGELVATVLVLITALLPAVGLLKLTGCGFRGFADVEGRAAYCLAILAVGMLLGFVIAVPAFGATGTYSSLRYSFRIDLHLRALVAGGDDSAQIIAFLLLLTMASQALEFGFSLLPLAGSLLAKALDTYTSFVGAHMIGVLFRRHAGAMDQIYR